jgi:hypothetical protein
MKKFFTPAAYLYTPTPGRRVYPHPWLPLDIGLTGWELGRLAVTELSSRVAYLDK